MSLRVRRVMKVMTDEKKGNTKCPQYIFKQFGASLTHFISIYFAKKSLGEFTSVILRTGQLGTYR